MLAVAVLIDKLLVEYDVAKVIEGDGQPSPGWHADWGQARAVRWGGVCAPGNKLIGLSGMLAASPFSLVRARCQGTVILPTILYSCSQTSSHTADPVVLHTMRVVLLVNCIPNGVA